MDIKDYLIALWRRKWIVLLTVIAALVVSVVGTRLITPVYQASTTLRVSASASGSLSSSASTYSNQLINTAAHVATSQPVLDALVKRLNLSKKPAVSAAVIPSSELIKITVEDSNADRAALIANTLAGMLIDQGNELYIGGGKKSLDVLAEQLNQYKAELDKTKQDYEALLVLPTPAPDKANVQYELLLIKQRNYESLLLQYDTARFQDEIRANMITVVEAAQPPKSPIQPQAAMNYLIGLALGLFGGIVLAFVAESFDSTLYSAKSIENISRLPVLANIPKAKAQGILTAPEESSSMAEASRNLATNLLMTDHQQPGKVLLIMGAEPKQGKSTVVHNLAVALSEYGKRVVAVDCDLRLPRLHDLFKVLNENGLTDVLQQKVPLDNVLSNPLPGISVLTSGPLPTNPSQMLGSPQMAEVIVSLRKQYDYVLLDTPALLAVSDTPALLQNLELVKNIDTIILIVCQEKAKREAVQEAGRFLQSFSEKRAGLVVNQTKDVTSYYYYRHPENAKGPKAYRPAIYPEDA